MDSDSATQRYRSSGFVERHRNGVVSARIFTWLELVEFTAALVVRIEILIGSVGFERRGISSAELEPASTQATEKIADGVPIAIFRRVKEIPRFGWCVEIEVGDE